MTEELMTAQRETPVAPEVTKGLLPPDLQTALARLDAATAQLEHVRALIAGARESRAQAVQRNTESFAQLAADEAAQTIDGTVSNTSLRRAALKGHEAVLIADARLEGIKAREQAAIAGVEAAITRVKAAADAWISAETVAARAAFLAATERFLSAIGGPAAIGLAFSDSRLVFATKNLVLPSLEEAGGNAAWQVRAWRENSAMLGIVLELTATRQGIAETMAVARNLIAGGKQEQQVQSEAA